MKNILFILSILVLLILQSCLRQQNSSIVNHQDYKKYLTSQHLEAARLNLENQLDFWKKKLAEDPQNYIYQKKLAGLCASEFKLTGNIRSLHQSDSLLEKINLQIPNQVGVLHALASNSITQHQFVQAENYLQQAYQLGERKFVTSLMLADVMLERGSLLPAESLLQNVESTHHFDFLIREMKYQDQIGNLDIAIKKMEEAAYLAQGSGSSDFQNWSLSNLADMYGHDGQIEKSYRTYLQALEINPADLHSLKGIAWIAFSHDKNTKAAKAILNFLKSIHPVPDYNLLLAEIAAFEGDTALSENLESDFLAKAGKNTYGNMYKTYICKLTNNSDQALQIASEEVMERPHPMSYSLLAWTNFQNGNCAKAVEITRDFVLGRTSEPDALFNAGMILGQCGFQKEGKKLLEEAMEASFELGPVVTMEIQKNLKTL